MRDRATLARMDSHADGSVRERRDGRAGRGHWPAGDTVALHRRQAFYLLLHHARDEPVQIWAEPYSHNLWPFETRMFGASSTVFMIVCWSPAKSAVRTAARKSADDRRRAITPSVLL